MRSARELAFALLPPIAFLLSAMLIWHFIVQVGGLPKYVLPGPLSVVRAAWMGKVELSSAIALTAAAAICGFISSLITGTLIAFAFSFSPLIRAGCYPYAVFLQTVPIVAIAPLIVVWFGYGFQSVALIAFIISLFPIITNATTGLTSIDRDLVDLFELHSANRWQVLFKLRLPSAVPYLVTGARVSSGMAVIGAIVGEFFAGYGGSQDGLGYVIMRATNLLKTDELFAAVIASTALGMAVFAVVNIAGATVLSRWYHA
ncbi:MAG: ABC transporter permease [Planctomycetaceae bacterium]|nr:ABC transporter permease [Planctomycetales bacterium]MCB9922695.1 ABC transporter permease [Planctomycetaceae bacterium]